LSFGEATEIPENLKWTGDRSSEKDSGYGNGKRDMGVTGIGMDLARQREGNGRAAPSIFNMF
jgi:hypothetical protein